MNHARFVYNDNRSVPVLAREWHPLVNCSSVTLHGFCLNILRDAIIVILRAHMNDDERLRAEQGFRNRCNLVCDAMNNGLSTFYNNLRVGCRTIERCEICEVT